jgi:hypothetical protein
MAKRGGKRGSFAPCGQEVYDRTTGYLDYGWLWYGPEDGDWEEGYTPGSRVRVLQADWAIQGHTKWTGPTYYDENGMLKAGVPMTALEQDRLEDLRRGTPPFHDASKIIKAGDRAGLFGKGQDVIRTCDFPMCMSPEHMKVGYLKMEEAVDFSYVFEKYVDLESAPGHWLWEGRVHSRGDRQKYPIIRVCGRDYGTALYLYKLLKGKGVDENRIKAVIRICDEELCVNPEHHYPRHDSPNTLGAPRREKCRRGHAFTPSNTIVRKDGSRECRACQQLRKAAYYKKQVEARGGRYHPRLDDETVANEIASPQPVLEEDPLTVGGEMTDDEFEKWLEDL